VEPRDRILGPISTHSEDGEETTVSFGDIVRKLVLFEQVVIESNRLKEIPLLVQKFGYDGVKALMESGRVRIYAEASGIGQIEANPKTPGVHNYGSFQIHNHKDYIHEGLQAINEVPGLNARRAKKLRKLVGDRTARQPDDRGEDAWDKFMADLESNAAALRLSTAIVVAKETGRVIEPAEFELTIARDDEGRFTSETDLGQRLDIGTLETYEIVSKGLLGVAAFNERLELMERFQSLTGFQASELPLFEEKLSFLLRQIDPDHHVDRFERVIELSGLPQVDPSGSVHDVDLARLVEITSSEEATEFRAWLRGIDSLSDGEIEETLHRMREIVRAAVESPTGKTIRFLTTVGAGVAFPPAGVAAGAIDSLVLPKLIGEPGATAFLSRLYPTIFKTAE
jgi:hypothetical protein